MSEVKSVSLAERHNKFLKETGLSASKLLQQAIEGLMEDYNNEDLTGLLKNQKKRNAALMDTIEKMNNFLNKQNLLDKYFEETTKKAE